MKLLSFKKFFLTLTRTLTLVGIVSGSLLASGLNLNTQLPIKECFTNEITSSELSNLYKSILPLEEKKELQKQSHIKKENPDIGRSFVFRIKIFRKRIILNFLWIGTVIFLCMRN